jgi:hypothetical protein
MTDEQSVTKKPRRVELTERDLTTLSFIGEQYAARLDQIQRLLGSQAGPGAQTPGILSESAARVWVSRMKAIDAVEMEKPYRAQPSYLWLRPAGLRLVELDFKYLKPAISTLNHLYWCNQVRLFLAERRPHDVWQSERFLRREHAQATKEKRPNPDLPDAHLLTQRGPLAIEVELTDKHQVRLNEVVKKRANTYYTTWYFCGSETRRLVERARLALPQDLQERIQIYDLPGQEMGKSDGTEAATS